ncbi:uncharacterized protein LOC103308346 [Acyrthosiphon pisum]|uniref:Uncharacterized protein n=1 Tax=Acyrthosiphon pisum TaxID=7029 RepID=A0A8R2H3W8_ACYPI|nr:uncharacterized protein LOC103308346 [Acyrthosiphon pisum]|eukprot:XP_016657283.1 PREDICTED: uncharacterized protein LOC103308346 [Acyrthosiphon pisum]
MALRVASAYCTVSNAAIMVVIGIIPIHLLALEKAEMEQARKNGSETRDQNEGVEYMEERMKCSCGRTLDAQADPDDRNLEKQEARLHGYINVHVTQFLTRHGCFNEYLFRLNKRNDAVCMYCDNPYDDAEHTFIVYGRWWRGRRNLEVELDVYITLKGMVDAM